MEKKNEEITTTELAGMIARGFASIQAEISEFRQELKFSLGNLTKRVNLLEEKE